MNKFINILTGWIALACVIVLGRTGDVLRDRTTNQPIVIRDYIFLGLVVASMFFLQYAAERYLVPPGLFTKERRKEMLEGSWLFYRRGAVGISYFFLIGYAVVYLTPTSQDNVNMIMPGLFFLILGMAGVARGIILHLAKEKLPA